MDILDRVFLLGCFDTSQNPLLDRVRPIYQGTAGPVRGASQERSPETENKKEERQSCTHRGTMLPYMLQSSHVDATTDDNTSTVSGYVLPNGPSVRKGYVVIDVSTYALVHASIF
jgi:hypothetical protein